MALTKRIQVDPRSTTKTGSSWIKSTGMQRMYGKCLQAGRQGQWSSSKWMTTTLGSKIFTKSMRLRAIVPRMYRFLWDTSSTDAANDFIGGAASPQLGTNNMHIIVSRQSCGIRRILNPRALLAYTNESTTFRCFRHGISNGDISSRKVKEAPTRSAYALGWQKRKLHCPIRVSLLHLHSTRSCRGDEISDEISDILTLETILG